MKWMSPAQVAEWLGQGEGAALVVNGIKIGGNFASHEDRGVPPERRRDYWLELINLTLDDLEQVEVKARRSSSGKWDPNNRTSHGCQTLQVTCSHQSPDKPVNVAMSMPVLRGGPINANSPEEILTNCRTADDVARGFTAFYMTDLKNRFLEERQINRELREQLAEKDELFLAVALAMIEGKGRADGIDWTRLKDSVSKRKPVLEKLLRGYATDSEIPAEWRDGAMGLLKVLKGAEELSAAP